MLSTRVNWRAAQPALRHTVVIVDFLSAASISRELEQCLLDWFIRFSFSLQNRDGPKNAVDDKMNGIGTEVRQQH
jgi:hypothetical protein